MSRAATYASETGSKSNRARTALGPEPTRGFVNSSAGMGTNHTGEGGNRASNAGTGSRSISAKAVKTSV